MKKNYLYGMVGLLSILGFIGVFTDEKVFLAFFSFAVNFTFFFAKSDEMLEYYMDKSASRAFFCGLIVTAIATLTTWVSGESGTRALLIGFSFSWAVSVMVYALSIAFYSLRETWGLEHDKNKN